MRLTSLSIVQIVVVSSVFGCSEQNDGLYHCESLEICIEGEDGVVSCETNLNAGTILCEGLDSEVITNVQCDSASFHFTRPGDNGADVDGSIREGQVIGGTYFDDGQSRPITCRQTPNECADVEICIGGEDGTVCTVDLADETILCDGLGSEVIANVLCDSTSFHFTRPGDNDAEVDGTIDGGQVVDGTYLDAGQSRPISCQTN